MNLGAVCDFAPASPLTGNAPDGSVQYHGASGDSPAFRDRFLACILQPLIDELDVGLIICDEQRTPLLVNFAARSEMGNGGPLWVDRGVLCTRDPACVKALGAAVIGAITARRRKLIPLANGVDRRFAVVLPLTAVPLPCALILLGRREVCPDIVIEMLAGLHAITPSERHILSGLLAGRRASTLAVDKGVGLSTVRTQINALRAKLGVSSIGEIMRLAARLPTATSALRSETARI